MLKPFDVAGNASLARTFAAGVSADIDSAMSAAGVDVVDPDSSGRSNARFVLSGRTELPGSDLHLTAELQDARDHTVLWSTTFTRPAKQSQAMQEQVADNLAQVLHCAFDTSRQPGGENLDQDTIKLYLKACALEQAVDTPSDQIQDLLKQVTAREPRFAAGWARLALFAADAAWAASPQDAATLRREARTAAQNALRLDPRSGVAFEALTDLELGRVPFAQLHREFQKVLSFDREDPYIINDDCELLLRMGSLDTSLRMCRRAVELEPLSPEQVSDLIKALIDQSRDAEAQATLDRALRVWPDDKGLKIIHLDYEARVGDPRTALAILDDPEARPQLTDISLVAYRRLAEARKSGSPAQARAFIEWMKAEAQSGEIDPQFSVPALAGFGDVGDAFRIAFAAPSDIFDHAPDPEFLWEPDSANLRRDPRFIALAAKFHVADFWRSTGLWPDFCSAPNWPYSCKGEEARLRPAGKAKS
jgi:TolB-like protein